MSATGNAYGIGAIGGAGQHGGLGAGALGAAPSSCGGSAFSDSLCKATAGDDQSGGTGGGQRGGSGDLIKALRSALDTNGDGSVSRKEIETFFQNADANQDGRLSADELMKALESASNGGGGAQAGNAGGAGAGSGSGPVSPCGGGTGTGGTAASGGAGSTGGGDLAALDQNADSAIDLEEMIGALLDSDA